MLLILILLSTILALLAYVDTRKPRNFPPGPKWFPIIGCAWQLRHLQIKYGSLGQASQELAVKYGPVVGTRIGRQLTVFVCGLEAIKEMYFRNELNGRPDDIFSTSRTFGKRRGIIFTDSEFQQEQKRFLLRQLKDSYFRKEIMGEILEQRVALIIDEIKEKIEGDGVICVSTLFQVHILNTMCHIMTGDKCTNQEMEELYSAMEHFGQNISVVGTTFSHFPFLKHICPDYCGYSSYVTIHKRILEFLSKKVTTLKETCCPPPHSDGIIHGYLRMLNSVGTKSSFSEEQLLAICLDLLIAGFDTTINVLGFLFIYLLLNPDVQKRAQEEIDTVIGRGRLLKLEDRPRLPYVECVFLESLRLFVGRAFLAPRRALKDTMFNGYLIPKDTIIQGNSRGTFLDENSGWKDPETFDPERFIKNGTVCIPKDFIPFGLGKRRCVGEILARENIFLIAACLLQTFNFDAVPGNPPKLDVVDNFTPSVKPFKAFVTLR